MIENGKKNVSKNNKCNLICEQQIYIFLFSQFQHEKTTQLRALVEYMGENPKFARGVPIFGSSRQSHEDHWKTQT